MKQSILKEKSLAFAVKIVNTQKYLLEQKEYVLSKQLLRVGTSIGANIRESFFAESKNDFIHKLHIALKEAHETEYWLVLLKETNYIGNDIFTELHNDALEMIRLLVSSIKTSKAKNNNPNT